MSLAAQPPQHTPHWEYTGDDGPAHWSTLAPEFAACAGRNQSPIDLDNFIEAELPPIAFDYKVGGHDVVNNGHTIQVDYDAGSSISIDDVAFALKQFHFHAPSENHIDGKSFPIEAHFVHADANGNLAVVALMFEQGDSNPALDKLWAGCPAKRATSRRCRRRSRQPNLLPGNRDYYRYEGSLTTPPCSEGVRWLVLKQPVPASAEQIGNRPRRWDTRTTGPCSPSGQESSCNSARSRLVPLPRFMNEAASIRLMVRARALRDNSCALPGSAEIRRSDGAALRMRRYAVHQRRNAHDQLDYRSPVACGSRPGDPAGAGRHGAAWAQEAAEPPPTAAADADRRPSRPSGSSHPRRRPCWTGCRPR